MTMTPEQEALVRADLQAILKRADPAFRDDLSVSVRALAQSALAALDGEGEHEEWEACRYVINGSTHCWSIRDAVTKDAIAGALTEVNARRGARLPKLERAAREVVVAYDHGAMHPTESVAIANLRAALPPQTGD